MTVEEKSYLLLEVGLLNQWWAGHHTHHREKSKANRKLQK